MGLMKKVDIEIRNSLALSYMNHELKALKKRVTELERDIVTGDE